MSDDYSAGSSGSDTSGSGSDDSSGSSDGSGSSSWGSDAWDAVQLPFPDTDSTARPNTTAGGTAARSPRFNAAMQRLYNAGRSPAVDARSLPRQLVEHPRWCVPVDGAGRELLLTIAEDERARRPFVRALAAGETARSAKPGPVGTLQVAQAFASPPNLSRRAKSRPKTAAHAPGATAPTSASAIREVSGRALARAMPSGVDGVLFTLSSGSMVGLLRDEWPLLERVAASLELEDLLVWPGPGQVAVLLAARWYVSSETGTAPQTWTRSQVIQVYTHPDRAAPKHGRMTELSGLQLVEQLAGRADYDGVMVNLESQVGLGDEALRCLSLGPDFGAALAGGVDPRAGVAPLPARTLAEVHLWLDFAQFPHAAHGRELAPVTSPTVPALPAGDHRARTEPAGIGAAGDAGPAPAAPSEQTVAQTPVLVQARTDRGSAWRIVETAIRQRDRPGPTLGPVFAVREPAAPPGHLGDGATQILCAGQLAHLLYEERLWRPRRWFVAKEHRVRAARLAGWAHELRKLLPPGADNLPRTAFRTLNGAGLVRRVPKLASRAWIEERCAFYDGVVRRGWLGL